MQIFCSEEECGNPMVAGFCEDLDSDDEPVALAITSTQPSTQSPKAVTSSAHKLTSRDVVLTSDESDNDDVTHSSNKQSSRTPALKHQHQGNILPKQAPVVSNDNSKTANESLAPSNAQTRLSPTSRTIRNTSTSSGSNSPHEASDTESAKQTAVILQDQEDVSDIECAPDDVIAVIADETVEEEEVETPKATSGLQFEDLSVLETGFDFNTGLPSKHPLTLKYLIAGMLQLILSIKCFSKNSKEALQLQENTNVVLLLLFGFRE